MLPCLDLLEFDLNQKNLLTKLGAINTELTGNVVSRFSAVRLLILMEIFFK